MKVVLAFSGLGKTYFCKHNLGWVDLENGPFWKNQIAHLYPDFIEQYETSGFDIMLNCFPYIIEALKPSIEHLTVYLPAENMKSEIIERVRERGVEGYTEALVTYYDQWYADILAALRPTDTIVFVESGKYLSDYII